MFTYSFLHFVVLIVFARTMGRNKFVVVCRGNTTFIAQRGARVGKQVLRQTRRHHCQCHRDGDGGETYFGLRFANGYLSRRHNTRRGGGQTCHNNRLLATSYCPNCHTTEGRVNRLGRNIQGGPTGVTRGPYGY